MSETVFMVMPFGDELADTAYRLITKPVVESFGLKIIRADEIFSTNPIFDDIVTAIENAAIVIVDISGKNPNCFYELGMAHTLKKSRTIMITQDAFKNVPFDIAHFRIVQYEDSIKGRESYKDNLRKTILSIKSGLGELYIDEFNLVVKMLRSTNRVSDLYLISAVYKSTIPISIKESFELEGHFKDPNMASKTICASSEDMIESFINLGYANIIDGIIIITEKGQAFNEYLASQGYVADRFNEQIFTEGYESVFEKMEKKKKVMEREHKSM